MEAGVVTRVVKGGREGMLEGSVDTERKVAAVKTSTGYGRARALANAVIVLHSKSN
jgi:hypothetical protein